MEKTLIDVHNCSTFPNHRALMVAWKTLTYKLEQLLMKTNHQPFMECCHGDNHVSSLHMLSFTDGRGLWARLPLRGGRYLHSVGREERKRPVTQQTLDEIEGVRNGNSSECCMCSEKQADEIVRELTSGLSLWVFTASTLRKIDSTLQPAQKHSALKNHVGWGYMTTEHRE